MTEFKLLKGTSFPIDKVNWRSLYKYQDDTLVWLELQKCEFQHWLNVCRRSIDIERGINPDIPQKK